MHLGAEGQQALLAQDGVHEEPEGGLRAGALSSGARTRRVQGGDKDGEIHRKSCESTREIYSEKVSSTAFGLLCLQVTQEVPEETCDLQPEKVCKHVTKMVPV